MPERKEYRVVGKNFRGEPFETALPGFTSQGEAEANLQTSRPGSAAAQ